MNTTPLAHITDSTTGTVLVAILIVLGIILLVMRILGR